MTDISDIALLDPAIRDLLALRAIDCFLSYGQPGAPGHMRALRADAKRALRTIHERTAVEPGETEKDIAA